MNQYEICRTVVQAGGMTTIDKIANTTGLSEKNLLAMLAKLTGEGVLVRDRALVKVKNDGKARELAGMADSPGLVIPTGQTRFAPTVVPPSKQEGRPSKRLAIPVGLEILSAVPIPVKKTAARPIALRLGEMTVGQCILVPIPDGFATRDMAERCRIEVAAFKKRINPDFNATIRATVFPENHPKFGEPCVGVWCILPEQAERAVNAKNNMAPLEKLKKVSAR